MGKRHSSNIYLWVLTLSSYHQLSHIVIGQSYICHRYPVFISVILVRIYELSMTKIGLLDDLADGTIAKPAPRRICGTKGLWATVHKRTQGPFTTLATTTTTPTVVPNPAIWGFVKTEYSKPSEQIERRPASDQGQVHVQPPSRVI